jgi:hypothetical protein
MNGGFRDIDEFWRYVHSTKQNAVRTVVFRVDYSTIQLHVLSTVERNSSTEAEMRTLLAVLKTCLEPVWFIVRVDFESPLDNAFALGHVGPYSLSVARLANAISIPFKNHDSIINLEESISQQLFPLHDPVGGPNGVILVEGLTTSFPRFKFLGPHLGVQDMCRQGHCAFIISPGSVFLLNPEGDCANCGVRNIASSERERAIYAFMKADLIEYLQSIDSSRLAAYTFTADLNSCAETKNNMRRRSSQDVLSPPTLEKYQKGSSKRHRNFSNKLQAG